MSKNRLEAFSDGAFAVIITIIVLDMKVPQGTDLHALKFCRVPLLGTLKLSHAWRTAWQIQFPCFPRP